MDKKTKILIGVGAVIILGYIIYKRNNKNSQSTVNTNSIPEHSQKPELSYEQHTFGLIADEIQEKGKDVGVDEEIINECKPIIGGWHWQKCFDKFGKGKSIEDLMSALEIIDKDEPSEDEIIRFNTIMLAKSKKKQETY